MSLNATTTACNYTNRTALLEYVVQQWHGHNISQAVQGCPGTCSSFKATEPPKLVAPGVTAIYILQGVLAAMFALVFLSNSVIHELLIPRPNSFRKELITAAYNVMCSTITSNYFIFLALHFAVVVQAPNINTGDGELAFYMALGCSESMIIFIGIACFQYMQNTQHCNRFTFGVWAGAMGGLGVMQYFSWVLQDPQGEVLIDIYSYCIKSRDFTIRQVDLNYCISAPIILGAIGFGLIIYAAAYLLILGVRYSVVNGLSQLRDSVKLDELYQGVCKRIKVHPRPEQHFRCFVVTTATCFWFGAVLVRIVYLVQEFLRRKDSTGKPCESFDWNLSQWILVLASTPLYYRLCLETIGLHRLLRNPEGNASPLDLTPKSRAESTAEVNANGTIQPKGSESWGR